jgi:PhzF family phenazine biosynthesis protein
MPLEYSHVDVFARQPFAGNSVPVFTDSRGLSGRQMLEITQELRHFEAIFLEPTSDQSFVRARVFDLFQELTFAGHPIIGAAAVLHRQAGDPAHRDWTVTMKRGGEPGATRARAACGRIFRSGSLSWLILSLHASSSRTARSRRWARESERR